MNPVSGVTWWWRAWRGQSVTFAALFASGVLGVSVLGALRHGLSRLGLPWYVWLVAPFFVVSLLVKKEKEWLPDEARRKKWARWLVIGSLIGAVLIAWLTPARPVERSGEDATEKKMSEPQGRAGVRHP